MKEFLTNSPEETINLALRIMKVLPQELETFCLVGDLAAGKTTFTKGVGKALGINRVINSPTFAILKMYEGEKPLYHFDLYRLTTEENDFSLAEYLQQDGVIKVVEWPNNLRHLLPKKYVEISIETSSERGRKFILKTIGSNEDWEELI